MKKRYGIAIFILLLLVAGILAFPVALRAIPPRYAARYLPEPLQELAAPPQKAAVLPTLASSSAAEPLLQTGPAVGLDPIAETAVSEVPPTLTPPIVAGGTSTTLPTATAVPTLSPTPISTATTFPIPAAARLEGIIDHHFQTWNNCGPATMAMTLSYFGYHTTQSDNAAVLKPNPEDRNVSPYEMADFVNEQTPYAAIDRVNGNLEALKRFVANGIPVIMEIGIDPPGEYRWLGWYGHYLLVVAYDDASEQFWVYDSWFGTSDVPLENADREGRNLAYAEVEEYWPHFNRSYIVVYEPDQADLVAQIIGEDMDDVAMWQDSLANAQAEAAADPKNAFFWFNLGTSYNAVQDYEKAASAFDQALAIGLPWRMLWYQFGPYEAYLEVGRYEDVITLAETTLENRPYFEESFYYKGLAHAALGNMDAAHADLRKAASFNPNYTPAVDALNQLEAGS